MEREARMNGLIDYWTFYLTDDVFRKYVDKYCMKHKMPPENAVKCIVVREYANYLKGGGSK